MLVTSTVC